MLAFAWLMNTVFGRWSRVVGGSAMIVGGLAFLGGPAGVLLAVVGLVPLLAGMLDICVLAPVIHTPFAGQKVRDILGRGRNGIASTESH
jgi:hypothetical protein